MSGISSNKISPFFIWVKVSSRGMPLSNFDARMFSVKRISEGFKSTRYVKFISNIASARRTEMIEVINKSRHVRRFAAKYSQGSLVACKQTKVSVVGGERLKKMLIALNYFFNSQIDLEFILYHKFEWTSLNGWLDNENWAKIASLTVVLTKTKESTIKTI